MTNEPPIESQASGIEAIIRVAREGVAPRSALAGSAYLVPCGDGTTRLIDRDGPAERFQGGLSPYRSAGTVTLTETDSLIAYVMANHHDPEGVEELTRLYASRKDCKIVAVIDDDGDLPAWRVWRAELQLQHTTAWNAWKKASGTFVKQEPFAELLEDRADDVVSPPAAQLIEIATTIKATASAKIESGIRLSSGEVRLSYLETVEATAGRAGQFTIPETFELALRVFEGGDHYKVRARLRWRRSDGGIVLGFVLNNPEDIERAAFDREIARIREGLKETNVPILFGTPAQPLVR